MPTAADQAAMTTYKSIVEEAMLRLHSIPAMIDHAPGLRPTLVREFAFLQLRLVCELIALGCLVCHGDLSASQSKRLQKSYVPAEILARLGELHPDFYPVPGSPIRTETGLHLDDYKRPFMTKADLIALWSKCGDHLHKGNLRKFLRTKDPGGVLRKDDIMHAGQMALNLLECHRISRRGNKLHFVTLVQHDYPAEGTVNVTITVAIAESPKSSEPEGAPPPR
jgi:hypothetical protein